MKNILVINFFPAFVPPSSGGELRYYNLYLKLSKYFNITLLSPTYSHHPQETIIHSDTFREIRVPKEDIHDKLHADISKENIADEFSALVCALSSKYHNKYHEIYLDIQENADIIIHESPYMLDYDILFGFDKRPRIYNSYNVESDLVSSVWKGESSNKYKKYIYELEKRLVLGSDAVFAVSKEDINKFKDQFNAFDKHFSIVPNGINPGDYLPRNPSNKKTVLFFGSFHQPNIEAADFIINYLAPSLPNVNFVIAGNCVVNQKSKAKNVAILGKISHEEKLKLLSTVDIAINPMFSGGGTNLKMLEYLVSGIPTITTPVGARGLDLINNKHVFIADKEEFKERILDVLNNLDFAKKVADEGKSYVIENFSWDAIAKKASIEIEKISEEKAYKKRNILVLNDFSASNPQGGGEVRINRIYSHLSKYYNIRLLCFSKSNEINIVSIKDDFYEIQIPKTEEHKEKENLFKWYISANDIVNFMEAPKNKLLSKVFNALSKWADIMILTHPYMVGLLENKNVSNKPIIYESHNAEFFLKKDLLKGHPHYNELIEAVKKCETEAIELSNRIVATSGNDIEKLIALGAKKDKIDIVPNGADVGDINTKNDISHIKRILNGRPFIVFIGSAHYPNVEAFQFINQTLSRELPEAVFGIIGSVCNSIPITSNNIILFGVLDDIKKDIVLELADIAINPIISGGGSNLKLAEYFSKGIAAVTTPFGARGYNIKNNTHAIICDLHDFAKEIKFLINDSARRSYLGTQGYIYAKKYLDWSKQAELFRYIIEKKILTDEVIENKRRLLVDVTAISQEDKKTGIQRVIRSQLFYLSKLLPEDFELTPVYLDNVDGSWCYKYANYYAFDIGLKDYLEPEIPVDIDSKDILYIPDWYPEDFLKAYTSGFFKSLKTKGVRIVSLIHDILPIQFPQYFPEGHDIKQAEWVRSLADISDRIVCVSKTVADSVSNFLNKSDLNITYIHNGADIENSVPTKGLPQDHERVLGLLTSKPSFLMVGTVEPRKGHLQTIKAFEILWQKGLDINLVIVGKEGWMVEHVIDLIRTHNELNKRLFWLSGISDEYLEKIYASSTCFIMASEGEGFGLPIIEAARYKLPIIARDIPVFREIAGDSAYYFPNDKSPQTLANTIENWLNLYKENKHPKPDGIKYITWKENVEKLLKALLGGE